VPKKNGSKIIPQFKLQPRYEDGSKIENKFIIIVRLNYLKVALYAVGA